MFNSRTPVPTSLKLCLIAKSSARHEPPRHQLPPVAGCRKGRPLLHLLRLGAPAGINHLFCRPRAVWPAQEGDDSCDVLRLTLAS